MPTESDNFASGIGSNWDAWGNDAKMVGASGAAIGGSPDYSGLVWKASVTTFDADQKSEVLVNVSSTQPFDYIGPGVRLNQPSGTKNGYQAYAHKTDPRDLFKMVAGVETKLTSGSGSYSDNDILRLEATGTTIALYVNNVLAVSVTDTSIASGQPGVAAYDCNDGLAYADDWTGTSGTGGITIEAAASMALNSVIQSVRTLSITASAGLSLSNVMSQSSNAALIASTIFNAANNMLLDGQSALSASVSIATELGIASSYGAVIDAAAALGLDSQQTSAGISELIAQAAIDVLGNLQTNSNAVMAANATMTLNGVITSINGSTIDVIASLIAVTAMNSNVEISIEGVATFSVAQTLAAAVSAELGAEVEFDVISSMIAQTSAVLMAQCQFGFSPDIQTGASRTIDGFGTFTVTTSTDATGGISVQVEVVMVKPGRRVVVQAQQRTVNITASSRSIIVH